MILPFTLQQLRMLKAVASEKSFTKAAKILYVSQPSLSKQIKILENRLGIILLNRENSTISLTEGGRVFLQYSERILALCEESCRALNDVKNGDRGNLTVGASQTIGTYLMPRVLALFAQNYPQINIKVQVYGKFMLKINFQDFTELLCSDFLFVPDSLNHCNFWNSHKLNVCYNFLFVAFH